MLSAAVVVLLYLPLSACACLGSLYVPALVLILWADIPDLEASAAANQERLNAHMVANWKMLVLCARSSSGRLRTLTAQLAAHCRQTLTAQKPNSKKQLQRMKE
ncbi:hypothetical protein WJX82_009725 [Trebouxia sp. C0006]